MTVTIKNPTADQLEAGGKVSGTYRNLPFEDETLLADDDDLYIGRRAWIRLHGNYFRCPNTTVTSYTPPEPPEPKPWWETCDANEWGIGEFGSRNTEVRTAGWWRGVGRQVKVKPRRVLIADADTEVIVPKAAVDQLRASVGQYGEINSYTSESKQRKWGTALYCDAYALLAAVDERGES